MSKTLDGYSFQVGYEAGRKAALEAIRKWEREQRAKELLSGTKRIKPTAAPR